MSSPAPTVTPIVELREYDIHPRHVQAYLEATTKVADLRKSLVPLKLFSFPDTGGMLHKATHAYYYAGGIAERDARRKDMAQSQEWKDYLMETRPYMATQQSNIFVEAPIVQAFDGEILGLGGDFALEKGNDTILELRRYKLILGYDTVPNFLKLYGVGLPSKLATNDLTSSLVTLLYCELGRLNEVVEIWRHGDGTAAMERSRVNAREATEWKQAIASIAPLAIEFTSTVHRPTSFSPLK
jgi:hypothetical protein